MATFTLTAAKGSFSKKDSIIVIGYDEKSKTGVHVRFKIRNPIQNVKQYKDTRKIEKGSVCNSKSKEYLFDVARQLKIDIPSKLNVGTLCDIIRARLIRNEIEERKIGDGFTKEDLLEAVPTARTVPQIFLNDELVGGFTELRQKLTEAA